MSRLHSYRVLASWLESTGDSRPSSMWIVGTAASGKTTLGRKVARQMGADFQDLDDLFWQADWTSASGADVDTALDKITAQRDWVIAGNYRRFRRPRMHLVDLPIWLDLPFHVTFRRLLGRTWRRCMRGELCCNGNRETFRRALLDRESILLLAIKTFRPLRRALWHDLRHRPHLRLRSEQDVNALLESIQTLCERAKQRTG